MLNHLGYRAATQQSYSDEPSMKELVIRLRDEYPQAGIDEIVRRFQERAQSEPEYLIASVDYAVRTTWNGIEKLRSIPRKPATVLAAERQQRETVIDQVREQLWLNKAMPNGKLLRYCTREDIAPWGPGFSKIHKKLKPGQTVGDALDEEQVRSIMK